MEIREGIVLALRQIRAQKLKSFFAVLGVIIGVMFLITVVSVVEGLDRYMKDDFARTVFGLNTITVSRIPDFESAPDSVQREWRRRPRLRFEDADAIRAQLRVPALVAIESHSQDPDLKVVAENGTEIQNVWFTAASADYFRIRQYDLEAGRLYSHPEDRAGIPVVVLGYDAADKLFGGRSPLGRWVKVNGVKFRVIGVMKKQGTLFGWSLDNRAIAPAYSPMARFVNPHGVVDNILVRVPDAKLMTQAMLELEAIMRVQRRLRPGERNNFALETAEDSMGFWTRISRVLYLAFPGLVAIALVVGGIVIMNIMLVSVVERTREIGMRKAVGARRRDILVQVLVESATLSGVGAIVGIAIGVAGAAVVRAASPLPAAIAPHWLIVSVLLGMGVGIVAGVYPAGRAARLDPVVALRAE